MKYVCKQQGFSLIELMISLAIGSIVMASVMTSFISQHETYIAQDDVVEMQQNARVAMDRLAQDIRSIGYDPDNIGVALTTSGINAGTASTLSFTRDDGSGGLETVEYSLFDAYAFATPAANDGKVDDLACKITDKNGNSSGRQPIAENVSRLEFRYLDKDDNPTSTVGQVRSIQIALMMESAHQTGISLSATRTYTTPSGTIWTSNSGYRSMFLTSTILCRNLGL